MVRCEGIPPRQLLADGNPGRPGLARPSKRSANGAAAAAALLLLVAMLTETARAQPDCVGDCGARDRVTAADLVRMVGVASRARDIAECPAGDADEDGSISQEEIEQAIHSIFLACPAPPVPYSALAGDQHDLIYSPRIVSRSQAAAIVAALDELDLELEEEITDAVMLLLEQQLVLAGRVGAIVVFADRQNEGDCEECLATCSGRCVQAPNGSCFCYERLPTDPARLVVLLLEDAEDERHALEAGLRPCTKRTLLRAGVDDGFSSANGAEPAAPSPGLASLILQNSGSLPANFDDSTSDGHFGHTFVLPQGRCIEEAIIRFRARPLAGLSGNDAIHIGFVNASGQFTGARLSAFFGTGNTGLPALLANSWDSGNYPTGAIFVLNLASVPGLLAGLDAQRSLDIYAQDDTMFDYIDLVYRLCNCPPPPPTPTPTPTPTSTPGPCAVAICKHSIPAGGTGFSFSSAFGGLQGITVDDGLCVPITTACGLLFDIFEVPQPGVTLTNISCSFLSGTGIFTIPGGATSAFEPGDNQVLFSIDPGGFLECQFTNRVDPTLTPTATRTPTPSITASRTVTSVPTMPRTPTSTRTATPTRTATAPVTPTCVAAPQGLVGWWPLDEPDGAVTVVDIGLPPADDGDPQPVSVGFPPNNDGPASVPGNLVGTPVDTAFFIYGPGTYVEVPHAGHLDLATSDLTIDAWVSPLPGPWDAGRDDLHIYPVVDKLDLATDTGYAFYVEVETICATCPPPPQQPQPAGELSMTSMRLVLVFGDGVALHVQRSAPFYTGSGLLFPFPTPPDLLVPPAPGWTHVAVIVDRAQSTLDFYADGAQLGGTVAPAAAANSGAPLWLGGTRLYGTPHAPGFSEFTLNEIEIFDVAVPATEMQGIAAANGGKCKDPPTVTPTGLPSGTPTNTPTITPTITPSATPQCFGEVCIFKFNDTDGDGVHDPGEAGLSGWTFQYFDAGINPVSTVMTGAQGFSCTAIAAPAVYTVIELPQIGWTQTFPPPPGTHLFGVECGQLVDLVFGNRDASMPVPSATPTTPPTPTPPPTAPPTPTSPNQFPSS